MNQFAFSAASSLISAATAPQYARGGITGAIRCKSVNSVVLREFPAVSRMSIQLHEPSDPPVISADVLQKLQLKCKSVIRSSMDFITRRAVLSDARSIASIHMNTQRHAYQFILPAIVQQPIDLDAAEANKREKLEQDAINQSCTFVAEDKENNIIGYASGGRNRDETLNMDSELYNLFVLPAYQNQGVGTALFLKVIEFLIDCNHQSLTLWTIPIPSTVQYYTVLGGVFHSKRAVQLLDTDIELHCYVWDNLISLQELLSKRLGV